MEDEEQLLIKHTFVLRWTYEFGKPPVKPNELKALPTQMRWFHEWYMDIASKGTAAYGARVKGDCYCHSDHEILLDFKDIFEVYRKEAQDIALISI